MNWSIREGTLLKRAHKRSLACFLLRKKNQIIWDSNMGAASNSNLIMHPEFLLLKALEVVM